jgi:hypothetical protein
MQNKPGVENISGCLVSKFIGLFCSFFLLHLSLSVIQAQKEILFALGLWRIPLYRQIPDNKELKVFPMWP